MLKPLALVDYRQNWHKWSIVRVMRSRKVADAVVQEDLGADRDPDFEVIRIASARSLLANQIAEHRHSIARCGDIE